MVTLRTPATTLARRLTLAEPLSGWSAVVAESDDPRNEARILADALLALGKSSVIRSLGADLATLSQEVSVRTEPLLLLLADDTVTEETWREIDLRRSWLDGLSPVILFLPMQGVEALHRAASHLASWLGGAFYRIDVRREVESLVEQGRVGDARQLARGLGRDSLGPIAKVLRLPKVSTRPASGGGSLGEAVRWLRENGQAFDGRWVALLAGTLVDSDSSRIALQERLATFDRRRDVLVLRVGKQ